MDKNSYSLLSKKHNKNEISLSFKTKPENSQTQCPLVSMNHNENSSITTDTPSDINFIYPSSGTVTPRRNSNVPLLTLRELDIKYNDDQFFFSSTEDMHKRLKNYMSDPNIKVDERKRLILLDWMMELSNGLHLKRDTYHLSSVLVDIYLSKHSTIDVHELQLLGVTCLIVAIKFEEINNYSIDTFAKATADFYTVQTIKQFELTFLRELNWKINVPHLGKWSNIIMQKWDDFSKERSRIGLPLFRDNSNYLLFKNYFSIIDVISLDYYHIFINESLICNSLLFLLVGHTIGCFDMNDILNCFEKENFNNNFYAFLQIFNQFLQLNFNLTFETITETIKYVCMFFNMTFDYKEPEYKGNSKEELLQMQTMNYYNKDSIKKILKLRNHKQ